MRSHPGSFRLSFLLPSGIRAESGCHQPSDDGCRLTVIHRVMVEILGPSRESAFDHATRFLRVSCRGRPPLSIAATLETPSGPGWGSIKRSDTWSIIVGADVAFSPTSLGPHFPRQATPAVMLELVTGGRTG